MARNNNHLVIMAGGVGSRFWPMSTVEKPKQFIDVLGVGRTLLQLTLDRFEDICSPQHVWIVTNKKYADIVHEQLPEVPVGNILLEPCRRNTAPCIAYVSWRIKSEDPKANIVVAPSDHIVTDVTEFRRVIKSCLKFTAETDAIVTLGMKPTRPETGYGYIQADLSISSARNKEIYRVDSFREKPDLATAKTYIEQNNYFWNAGIFIWSVNTIVNAFRIYQPSISKIFEGLIDVYGTPQEQVEIDMRYPNCEKIMQTHRDLYGNSCIGPDISMFDSHNCIVHATQEKKVVIQGLDDYIVAEKDDTLLICKMSEEQRIKQFCGEE